MSLTSVEAKRQRRVRRQNHRRKVTKAEVEKRYGKDSGIRKHPGTSANPTTKQNRSTKKRKVVNAGKLGTLFKRAFKKAGYAA